MILSRRPWQTQILSAAIFMALSAALYTTTPLARAQSGTAGEASSDTPKTSQNDASSESASKLDGAAKDASQAAKDASSDVSPDDTQQNGTTPSPHPQTPGPNATASDSSTASTPANQQPEVEPPGGKRVFGVLPNYRTADASQEGTSISARQKLTIATKDSFDYPLVILAAALAGVSQLGNQNPSFGQGVEGYAHRWVTGYADQAMGNMFTEGLFPMMLHEDPRYFRRGSGSIKGRTAYALTRIFVTKTDSGSSRFNYSEWLGNAAGVAISNTYYPDGRTWGDNTTKLLEQCATDALSQVLKEFWPDIKRKWFHKDAH